MKKLLAILLFGLLAFTACDDIPSEIIDSANADYKLISVDAPFEFTASPTDSTFRTTIAFENTSSISSVWFDILTDDGTVVIKQRVPMLDDGSADNRDTKAGDGVYSGTTLFGSSYATANYTVEYFVEDNVRAGNDKIQKVAAHKFFFISGKGNSAPVISNLIAPDTVVVQDPKSLVELHVSVADSNGLVDISSVSFDVFGPGSGTGNKVSMFDDGKESNGDEAAADGIYSRVIEVTPDNTTGDYRFEFSAKDRSGATSNKIIHTITIK